MFRLGLRYFRNNLDVSAQDRQVMSRALVDQLA